MPTAFPPPSKKQTIYATLYSQALDQARFLPQSLKFIEGSFYRRYAAGAPNLSDPSGELGEEGELEYRVEEGWVDAYEVGGWVEGAGKEGKEAREEVVGRDIDMGNRKMVGGFRFLITSSTNPTKRSQGFGRDIPYTRDTFEKIVDQFKLPKQFLELVSNCSSGVFARVKDINGGLGFIIQNPDSARTQAMKLTLILHHDPTTNLTTGILHYWDWYSGLFEMFISLLKSDPERCLNPYYFPVTFLKAHHLWSESFRNHLGDLMLSFADLEDLEDVRGWGDREDCYGEGKSAAKSEQEIKSIMNQISRFIHNLPTENSHAVFQGNMCEILLKELEGKDGQEELYEVLELLKFQIAGHKEAIGSLRTRIEARNSMLYNRISQSESRLNYQIAKAARMDSYDMRAIALLTTCFLPGTFVATFFGAQLVKFDNINSAMKIYWALTIPLTFLVVSAWLFWSWMHKRNDNAKEKGGRDTRTLKQIWRDTKDWKTAL